jgi:hypothetical protein
MSPRADLFIVCKHCGSEVSPYVTECPYCGQRLRRRAPKIPRENATARASAGLLSRLARGGRAGARGRARGSGGVRMRSRGATPFAISGRPYVTGAAVAASCAIWVATRGGHVNIAKLAVIGPLHGDWWKLFTSEFTYINGLFMFVALLALGLFGWLIEQRHGPAVALALILGAGVAGALVETAAYPFPVLTGGNAPALALLAAWAAPDLLRAREGSHYEGDLLGAFALAAVLLIAPFVLPATLFVVTGAPLLVHAVQLGHGAQLVQGAQASWLAGVTGCAIGLLVGVGLERIRGEE